MAGCDPAGVRSKAIEWIPESRLVVRPDLGAMKPKEMGDGERLWLD